MRENCTYGIDEGELEIEPFGHYASSLLYRRVDSHDSQECCVYFVP
jgi:hypothetical protein